MEKFFKSSVTVMLWDNSYFTAGQAKSLAQNYDTCLPKFLSPSHNDDPNRHSRLYPWQANCGLLLRYSRFPETLIATMLTIKELIQKCKLWFARYGIGTRNSGVQFEFSVYQWWMETIRIRFQIWNHHEQPSVMTNSVQDHIFDDMKLKFFGLKPAIQQETKDNT